MFASEFQCPVVELFDCLTRDMALCVAGRRTDEYGRIPVGSLPLPHRGKQFGWDRDQMLAASLVLPLHPLSRDRPRPAVEVEL